MDEYYCPNCDAILNYQSGFDPEYGVWTCTSCGMQLMDEDVYEGNEYEGVAWYCDECGALLNKQSGFCDSYSTWTCAECGYSNDITEDNIYESEAAYKKHSFAEAIADSVVDVFSDAMTDLLQEKEIKRQEELRQEVILKAEKEKKNKLRKKRFKAFLFNHKKIMTRISSIELIGSNYSDAMEHFINEGFTNIRLHPLKDIYLDDKKQDGEIEEVTIDGISFFDEKYKCSYNAQIIILYHQKKEFAFPYDNKHMGKFNYKQCEKTLHNIGFTNIHTEAIPDLITGWLKKDGSVEEISVDNFDNIKAGQYLKFDIKITVKYHTFAKKNKRSK